MSDLTPVAADATQAQQHQQPWKVAVVDADAVLRAVLASAAPARFVPISAVLASAVLASVVLANAVLASAVK